MLSGIFSADAMGRGSTGILSVVCLFWTASAMFGGINRAFRRAWRSRSNRHFLVNKLRHMVMALTVGILFCVSMAASTAENQILNFVARLAPFAMTGLVFLLLYKFLPDAKTRWRHIWPGVLLAAVLFEIAKASFVLYLSEFADYRRVYGALGSVIALLFWVYLCSLILIVGAEFAAQCGRMKVRQARQAASGPDTSSESDPSAQRP